jgi:hypothetical protein
MTKTWKRIVQRYLSRGHKRRNQFLFNSACLLASKLATTLNLLSSLLSEYTGIMLHSPPSSSNYCKVMLFTTNSFFNIVKMQLRLECLHHHVFVSFHFLCNAVSVISNLWDKFVTNHSSYSELGGGGIQNFFKFCIERQNFIHRVLDSQSGDYEEFYLLGHNAM